METLEYIIRVVMVVVPILGLSALLLAAPFYFMSREAEEGKKKKKGLNKDDSFSSN